MMILSFPHCEQDNIIKVVKKMKSTDRTRKRDTVRWFKQHEHFRKEKVEPDMAHKNSYTMPRTHDCDLKIHKFQHEKNEVG